MNPKKVILKNDKKFYWSEGDLHTSFGVFKESDIKSSEGKISTHSEKEAIIMHASFNDKMQKISRGPQAIMEKDVGSILAYTSPSPTAKIIEVGAGSGKLTCYLAHFFPQATVISYEKNKENIELAKKNLSALGLKHVEFKHVDVLESFSEEDIDILILDIPDAALAVKNVSSAIKNGGYLVSYLPSITQVQDFVKELENSFILDRVLENIEREWHVEGRKVRPKSPAIMHTAFLVFARKV